LKPSPLFKEVYVVATVEGKSCEIEDQYLVEKEGKILQISSSHSLKVGRKSAECG
jgi:hypothetical protein